MTSSVVVDTNVFTARLRRDSSLASQYARHLAGELIAVTPQTVAKARYGALKSGWGPRRTTELRAMTADVTVLPVDAETVERVAQLRNECRRIGHALHQRHHNADLWSPRPLSAGAFRSSLTMPCSSAVLASSCARN